MDDMVVASGLTSPRGGHKVEKLDGDLLKNCLGGRGLGVKVCFDEVSPQADPLSPDNKLIFSSGPMVGTGAVTGASCNVVTRSALTGTLACAKMRGHFGAEMKFAGFDLIIIEGKAETPVILSIMDDTIRLVREQEIFLVHSFDAIKSMAMCTAA